MLDHSEKIIAGLEDHIDKFVKSGYTDTFLTKSVVGSSVSNRVALDVIRYYDPLLIELRNIEIDPDLGEAYSHLKPRERKRYVSVVENIIDFMNGVCEASRATRKPRKRKIISPEKLTENVVLFSGKYRCGSVDLETKDATEIIKAGTVFVFNTRYNIITMFVGLDGGLSVKGKTIINYDENKSVARRINAEKFLCRDSWTQPALENILNNRTKAGAFTKVTGRLSENSLIVRAYK